jgi:hypothetical protein
MITIKDFQQLDGNVFRVFYDSNENVIDTMYVHRIECTCPRCDFKEEEEYSEEI